MFRYDQRLLFKLIINCAKCFILTVNLQIGLTRSDLWNSQCTEFPQISIVTMTTYNPKSEKVGTVWKTQIKKESSHF